MGVGSNRRGASAHLEASQQRPAADGVDGHAVAALARALQHRRKRAVGRKAQPAVRKLGPRDVHARLVHQRPAPPFSGRRFRRARKLARACARVRAAGAARARAASPARRPQLKASWSQGAQQLGLSAPFCLASTFPPPWF